MKKKTEKEKADLVIKKIVNGIKTTIEDQQVFMNNVDYIERKLKEKADREVNHYK